MRVERKRGREGKKEGEKTVTEEGGGWKNTGQGLWGFLTDLGCSQEVEARGPCPGLLSAKPYSTVGPRAQCLDWDVPGKKVKGPRITCQAPMAGSQCGQRWISMPQLGLQDLGPL